MRANLASREVVAGVEIEDGIGIDLRYVTDVHPHLRRVGRRPLGYLRDGPLCGNTRDGPLCGGNTSAFHMSLAVLTPTPSGAALTSELTAVSCSIRLPEAWPLEVPEVDFPSGTKGVAQAKARRWLLGISVLLRSQNGSVADAIRMWHRSVCR